MHTLSLDPGGTPSSTRSRSATGWSIWRWTPTTLPVVVAHGQAPGNEFGFKDWWLGSLPEIMKAVGVERFDEIVSERFVLDDRTEYPDVTPLKIEGVLCAYAPETIFQRNVMKSHMPDAKVKELGWWWKGQGHAIDSGRHFWARRITTGHKPSIMAVAPIPESKRHLLAAA